MVDPSSLAAQVLATVGREKGLVALDRFCASFYSAVSCKIASGSALFREKLRQKLDERGGIGGQVCKSKLDDS